MDNQGLRLKAEPGLFKAVPWAERDLLDASWFTFGEAFVGKADFKRMAKELESGAWKFWRMCPPAEGVAVTHPLGDRLFVYYLHGQGLFGTVSSADLLSVARAEGLNGLLVEVHTPSMMRILTGLGFRVVDSEPPNWWQMELTDGLA